MLLPVLIDTTFSLLEVTDELFFQVGMYRKPSFMPWSYSM